MSPRSLTDLLGEAAERCHSDDLAFLAAALGRLPLSTATDQAAVRQRHREKEVIRAHLARLCHEQPAVAATHRCGRGRGERRPGRARRPSRAPKLSTGLLAHRGAGARVSALLRHQYARRAPDRGRAGLRRHARTDPRVARRPACSTGCASITPTGSVTLRGTSAAAMTPVRTPGSWPRRSSPRASGSRRRGRLRALPAMTSSPA